LIRFVACYESNVDVITTVPIESLTKIKYKHVGEEINISSRKETWGNQKPLPGIKFQYDPKFFTLGLNLHCQQSYMDGLLEYYKKLN
jgi:hypothetical protein